MILFRATGYVLRCRYALMDFRTSQVRSTTSPIKEIGRCTPAVINSGTSVFARDLWRAVRSEPPNDSRCSRLRKAAVTASGFTRFGEAREAMRRSCAVRLCRFCCSHKDVAMTLNTAELFLSPRTLGRKRCSSRAMLWMSQARPSASPRSVFKSAKDCFPTTTPREVMI